MIGDTQTITFTSPELPTGLSTLTVQTRGGLGQKPVLVDAVPLSELPAGYITTVAGGSTYAGEGGPARAATINPWGLAVDPSGNVFVADVENHRVRRIDSRTGTITTVAGTGVGDGFSVARLRIRVLTSPHHGPPAALISSARLGK